MKKCYLLASFFSYYIAMAQVTGINTVPGTFSTIALAISTLNTKGVAAGGATINIAANYTETAPAGGYLLGSVVLNPSLASTNPLVIQKDPATSGANPALTAFTGTSSIDGIFKIAGADYVTLNSIDLKEVVTNINATKQMEWGYAIVKLSGSDGAQNIVISNCSISLDRTNIGSVGIYSGNHLPSDKTDISVSSPSGTNANIKINGCTISNCYVPIQLNGSTAIAYYDTGLEIGPLAGNTLTNFGGTNVATFGITVNGQNSGDIENNKISTVSGSTGSVTGINISPNCAGDFKVNNNSLSLSSKSTANQLIGINNSAPITSTLDINNNSILNCDYTTAYTGNFYGICDQAATGSATVNINGNTISGTIYSDNTSAGMGIGQLYGIYKSGGTSTNVNVNNNDISNNFLRGSGGGNFAGIYISSGTNQTVNNNLIDNNSLNGGSTSAGSVIGIYSTVGNIVNGNNQVSNIGVFNTSFVGTVYGIYNISTAITQDINSNRINNLFSAGAGSVVAIYTSGNTANKKVRNNYINTLTSAGGTIYGLYQANGGATISGNKIFDFNATAGTGKIFGIHMESGNPVSIFNNLAGDFRTPSATGLNSIIGLSINGGNAGIYFNTIYLNSTSTSLSTFGTSAFFVSNSSASLTVQNNIFVNKSASGPSGGFSSALRYKNLPGSSYGIGSNNNLFFAGTPTAVSLIYGEGEGNSAINPQQTLSGFKSYINREAASVTEDPPFVSTIGTDPLFLHVKTSIATLIENGGTPVAGIADDFDGNPRNLSTPDIGADEFTTVIIVLPVSLTSFSGNHDGIVNLLKWTTVSEKNCRGFLLQRSEDGRHFTDVKFIPSLSHIGYSDRLLNYSYADSNLTGNSEYYRLRQTDIDNRATFSNIISIIINPSEQDIKIFPVPVVDKMNIKISLKEKMPVSLSITDVAGNILLNQNNQLEKGTNKIIINLSKLPAGNYFLHFNGSYHIIRHFIKQ